MDISYTKVVELMEEEQHKHAKYYPQQNSQQGLCCGEAANPVYRSGNIRSLIFSRIILRKSYE